MSIEKYLNEIYGEPATEGIGLILVGTFVGIVAISAIITKIEENSKNKKLTFRNINQLKKYIDSTKEINISKSAVSAIDIYNMSAKNLKKNTDVLFNEAVSILKKYQMKIPNEISDKFLNKCQTSLLEVNELEEKINKIIKSDSEILTDISLKNNVSKMLETWSSCWTNRINGDDLGEEILNIIPGNSEDEDDTIWKYEYKYLNKIINSYNILYRIPYKINTQIKIRVK